MNKSFFYIVFIVIVVILTIIIMAKKKDSSQYPALTFEGQNYEFELSSESPKDAEPSLKITPGPMGATLEFEAQYLIKNCAPNQIKFEKNRNTLFITQTPAPSEGSAPAMCSDPRWYTLKGIVTQLDPNTEYTLKIWAVDKTILESRATTTHEPALDI